MSFKGLGPFKALSFSLCLLGSQWFYFFLDFYLQHGQLEPLQVRITINEFLLSGGGRALLRQPSVRFRVALPGRLPECACFTRGLSLPWTEGLQLLPYLLLIRKEAASWSERTSGFEITLPSVTPDHLLGRPAARALCVFHLSAVEIHLHSYWLVQKILEYMFK